MAMVVDPICGMRIDSDDAVATAEYEDQTFYFCSEVCRDVFVANRVSDAVGTEPERLIKIELAERSGVSIEDIRELVNLGILEPENGRFSRRDLMRARVVPNLAAKGIGVEAIGTALASGHLTLGYLESAGRRFPRSNWTFSDLGRELGIPVNRLQMLYVTLGCLAPKKTNSFGRRISRFSGRFRPYLRPVSATARCCVPFAFGGTASDASLGSTLTSSTTPSSSRFEPADSVTTRRSRPPIAK
jgi:YHS domain-containing protein